MPFNTLLALLCASAALASPLQLPFFPASHPTSASLPSQNTSVTPVRVSLGVMSRCPDATLCETVWDRVLEARLPASLGGGRTGDLVEMELLFLARENATAPYGADCMHGEQECRGNVQQLCAAEHWRTGEHRDRAEPVVEKAVRGRRGWEDWWNFVQCMNYGDRSRIGSDYAARHCAAVVGRQWTDTLAACVEGQEGRALLRASLRHARKLGVEKSCTVLVEEKGICIHDGSWKACPGGHEVRDFAREVREAYERINRRVVDGGDVDE